MRIPEAAKRYEVLLNSGEKFEVEAINEYHTGSMVVCGDELLSLDQCGSPLNAAKVNRENIKSVQFLDAE